MSVPCRQTLRSRIISLEDDHCVKVHSVILSGSSTFVRVADAWSSIVYKTFMAVAVHLPDKKCVGLHTIIKFNCFSTPQTGKAAHAYMYYVIIEWGLTMSISSTVRDNTSDMCKGMKKLRKRLFPDALNTFGTLECFHV